MNKGWSIIDICVAGLLGYYGYTHPLFGLAAIPSALVAVIGGLVLGAVAILIIICVIAVIAAVVQVLVDR
jgi:hypothetical protein